jgi:uncharacterized metal-binding protein YceD (DUF177 family)
MKIHIRQIPDEGLILEDEMASDLVACPEFQPTGPIRYRVEATYSTRNLLVRGCLRVEGQAPCVRCVRGLPVSVEVANFTVLIEKPEAECVDLTEQVREDILLNLPAYVRCELDESQRCPLTGERWGDLVRDEPVAFHAGVWSVLDKLGETEKKKD